MPSYIFGKLNFNNASLQKDLETIRNFPRISEEYDEFGTGYWVNNTLWNATNDNLDTIYRDYNTPIQQTDYCKQLPYINEVIQDSFNFDYLKMVRTRNLIDGLVIPHKDFVELEKPKEQYFRVMVPLENNRKAFHSDEENVFQMQKGEVWFLDAALVHAAANFSSCSRIFLCLDFVFPHKDFSPSEIFKHKNVYNLEIQPLIIERKSINQDYKNTVISSLSQVITQHNFKDIVFLLSKIHFTMDVSVSDCYDWLIEITNNTGDPTLVKKAKDLKKYSIENRELMERFSMNEWVNRGA